MQPLLQEVHTSSNKTSPPPRPHLLQQGHIPNLSQTVLHGGDQEFKHMDLRGPFMFKPQSLSIVLGLLYFDKYT